MATEYDYKKFSSLESMEFCFLEEVKIPSLDVYSEKLKKFNDLNFRHSNSEFGVVVKQEENRTIILGGRYGNKFFVVEGLNLEVGKVILVSFPDYRGKKIMYEEVNEDLLDIKSADYKVNLSDLLILSKASYETELKRINKEREGERKKQEKKEKEWEKQAEKGEKDFVSGVFEKDNFKIEKNILTYQKEISGKKELVHSVTIKKAYNQLYSFNDVNGYNFGYSARDYVGMVKSIVSKGEKDVVIRFPKQSVEIKIEDRNSTINGVVVRKNMIMNILNNCRDNFSDERIKLINSLGITRIDFMQNEKLNVGGSIDVGVKFDFVNRDLLKVTIGNDTKEISWKDLKNYFNIIPSNTRSDLSYERFVTFMNEVFGKSKAETLQLLKDYKTLQDI